MRLIDRLNSFPVIAVAALVLAGLVGLGVGFVSIDSPSPTILHGNSGFDPDGGSASGIPLAGMPADGGGKAKDGRLPANPDGRTGSTGTDTTGPQKDPRGGNTGSAGSNSTTTGPVVPGETRKLPEGRVDEIETTPPLQQANCAIEVSVKDMRGNSLMWAKIALDVNSGPLGWHGVSQPAKPVPDRHGTFRFEQLYPGEYRVRSLTPNYKAQEHSVRLLREGAEENLSLTLQPLDYSQVEFYVRYEDGSVPPEVEIRIDRNGQEDTTRKGRFGQYDTGSAVSETAGVVPPTRYRQRTSAGGLITVTMPQGERAEVAFGATRDEVRYRADVSVTPGMGVSQEEVVLQPASDDGERDFLNNGNKSINTLEVSLTLDGKPAEFKQVNLRATIDDFRPRVPNQTDGNRYTWQNVVSGRWYLVAESTEFHVPYVRQIDMQGDTVLNLDVRKGHLRVIANRESGTPDPTGKDARYRVRLRPLGSGTIERSYNGNLTGKQTDHIDFFVPEGTYDVRVESPEQFARLAVSPVEQSLTMTAGGEVSLTYTIAAAATLKFRAVTSGGLPVPNVEYLVTFHPAGEVPIAEQGSTRKGDYDGTCEFELAPAGPVYVMIWSQSQDWNNPDKVFQLDLPPYGTTDLGAVIVQP